MKIVIFVADILHELREMDIVWSILACLLAVVGIIGAVVPVLPGPLLSYSGLLCMAAASFSEVGAWTLCIWGAATVAVTVSDYLLPAYMAKRFGGSRLGAVGATVGAILGLIWMPVGILLGPFFGAVIGELIHDRKGFAHALHVGVGSFLAFLVGTGLKLIFAIVLAVQIVAQFF